MLITRDSISIYRGESDRFLTSVCHILNLKYKLHGDGMQTFNQRLQSRCFQLWHHLK